MIKNVCIFASSCNFLEESYYKETENLGGDCLQRPDTIWFMAEVHWSYVGMRQKVKNNGGKIIGIMPEN